MSLLSKLRCALTLGQGVFLSLPEPTGKEDPFTLFEQWLTQAEKSGIILPESMNIATVDPDGKPSSRTVLLKAFDEQGFVFFTNYESRKGQALSANPYACLNFHWNMLQRQVRIEGRVEKITQAQSSEYFHSRGRGSQIGAWASKQSQVIDSRQQLEARVAHYTDKFAKQEVPLPEFWGGYRVIAERIEFWQGKADRLHDRFRYTRQGATWQVERLCP